MSRRREIQVGVTVIVAVVVLLWGVTWLREFSLGRRVHVWHVRFPQTGGLGASDEVQVNGIRKGTVSHIDLQGDHVVVDLAIASEIALTSDCRVAIRNVGLMGERVIAVDMHPTGTTLSSRDTIDGIFEEDMGSVMAGMGPTLASMDRVVRSLDALAQRLDKNGDLDKTILNLRIASDQLAGAMKENRAVVHESLQDLADVSKTAKSLTTDREAQYKRTLDSIERSTHNIEVLSARLDSLRAVAQSIASKVDHGEGSAAKLLNDKGLYEDARGAVKAMQDLLEDLKKNPKKYINVHVL